MKKKRGSSYFLILMFQVLLPLLLLSCTVTKPVAADRFGKLVPPREFIRVHAGDSTWMIYGYTFDGVAFKGKITRTNEKIENGRILDLYAAPSNSVAVSSDTLSVKVDNIGKAETTRFDFFKTAGTVVSLMLVFFWASPIFM